MNIIVKMLQRVRYQIVAAKIKEKNREECPVGNSKTVIDWYVKEGLDLHAKTCVMVDAIQRAGGDASHYKMPKLLARAIRVRDGKTANFYVEEYYRQMALNAVLRVNTEELIRAYESAAESEAEMGSALVRLAQDQLNQTLSALPGNRQN